MHRRTCPDYPNQAVGKERAHPAGQGISPWTAERQWLMSPLIGPLDEWANYFDFHLEDEEEEADA